MGDLTLGDAIVLRVRRRDWRLVRAGPAVWLPLSKNYQYLFRTRHAHVPARPVSLYSVVGIVGPDISAALNVEHYVDGFPTGAVLRVYDNLPCCRCAAEHMLHTLMQQDCDTVQRHDDQDLGIGRGFPYPL